METIADARRNLELAEIHPELYPATGLYPTHLFVNRPVIRVSYSFSGKVRQKAAHLQNAMVRFFRLT